MPWFYDVICQVASQVLLCGIHVVGCSVKCAANYRFHIDVVDPITAKP